MIQLLPRGARVLAVGAEAEALLEGHSDYSVTRVDPDALEASGNEHFDAVLLVEVLEHADDPGALLRRARQLLAEGGAVVASIPNAGHGSVRLALLAGRFAELETGPLDGQLRFFTRETIEDLFSETGYLITHWGRERADFSGSPLLGREVVRELLSSDPESTTYRFAIRAVPSDAVTQLAALQVELRAARDELDSLRRAAEDAEGLKQELEALRRAHDERGRRLVAERLEFSNELGELQRHIETIHQSRSFRYTAVFRRLFSTFRSRR